MLSRKIDLSGDVTSCALARQFVEVALDGAIEDLRQRAFLLTSEVVTNSVLHAGGPVSIAVHQAGNAYRICVSDRSKSPPAQKEYQPDDATGRGLHLLDCLAAAWGWHETPEGKVVWFDLPVPLAHPLTAAAVRGPLEEPYPDGAPIALLCAPVAEMIRTAAHYDALYREFRLILELDRSHLDAVPGRLLGLIDELGSSFLGFGNSVGMEWETAVRERRDSVDLHFRLPVDFAPIISRYNDLLDEADDYCRSAQLLTVAPSVEALAVRRWVFGQVVCQCRGQAPRPWSRSDY